MCFPALYEEERVTGWKHGKKGGGGVALLPLPNRISISLHFFLGGGCWKKGLFLLFPLNGGGQQNLFFAHTKKKRQLQFAQEEVKLHFKWREEEV